MIRDYFDRIITMSTKKKAITAIALILVLWGILSQLEFTNTTLPLIQHKGLLSGDAWGIILFSFWVLFFAIGSKYFLMDSRTLGFRKVILENFLTVFLIGSLIILFSIASIGYLVTGKVCLFVNSACLN